MTGNDINPLLEIFRLADGFIGLGIALWIIRIGIQRLDTMQAQYRVFVETVLGQ